MSFTYSYVLTCTFVFAVLAWANRKRPDVTLATYLGAASALFGIALCALLMHVIAGVPL